MDPHAKTWILTGGIENFRIYADRNFDLIGFKERRVRQAEQFEPGDEIVFYVTGFQAFAAIARVLTPMFEDREPIWPQGKKKYPEAYPWRVEAEPIAVLDEQAFIPAETLVGKLEHIGKWPEQHWQLAFQGQLRVISPKDADLLRATIERAATVRAAGA